MRRYLVLTHSIVLMHLRDWGTLFWNFAFPVGLMLLFGSIWGNGSIGGVNVAAWLMAGLVVQNILGAGLIGDSAWPAYMRDRGVLLRIRATPLPAALLIGSYLSVRLIMLLIQSALIISIALLVFDAQLRWENLPLAVAISVLGGIVFIGIGQALAAIAPSVNLVNAASQVFYYPLIFLSNLFIPLESLPEQISSVARWNPAYMLVDLLRPALTGLEAHQDAWINVLGLTLYGAFGLLLAARFFRWEPKR